MILGDITFKDFEVPPVIRFGASQRVAIHRLSGGGRVVDTLGRDDADIEFSGILCGNDAIERVAQISALSTSGNKTPLAWDAYYFNVIVKEFIAEYKSNKWIPYHLSCTICPTSTNIPAGAFAGASDGVAADIRQAAALFAAGRVTFAKMESDFYRGNVRSHDSNSNFAALSDLSALDEQITAGLIVAEREGTESGSARIDIGDASATGVRLMVDKARTIAFLTTAQAYTRRAAARLRDANK